MNYLEDFDSAGQPVPPPGGHYWYFVGDIYPSQSTWDDFVPGDGFAYITVDPDTDNDTDQTTPYQILGFGSVGEGHSLEARMKGAIVDGGLVSFLFTYNQTGSIFNEIDIEIVADDEDTPPDPHQTQPCAGWTDGRFNTWRNADESTGQPSTWSSKPVTDVSGKKKSLLDGEFHTYTIDWRPDRVDFFIDGVLQESHTDNIATGASEVIIGFRDLAWDGEFNWTGTRTLVLDYLKIEPLGDEPSAKFAATTRRANPGQSITFISQSPTATSWNWSFPGGNPASATMDSVSVMYDSVGTSDVIFTATNTSGADTATLTGYVTIDTLAPSVAGGNDGFEQGFTGWTRRQLGGNPITSIALDSSQVLCGGKASVYGGAATYEQMFADITGLSEGNVYTLHFYAAGAGEADFFIGPCADIYSGVYHYVHAGSSEYELQSIPFTATAEAMRVWFDFYPGSSVYVDAFSFDNALCPARVLHVDAGATGNQRGITWAGALTGLSDALVLAAQCPEVDSIRVAEATYLPDTGSDRNASFVIPDSLVILGGFPHGGAPLTSRDPVEFPTILSGDIGTAGIEADNVFHVVEIDSTGTAIVLDGLYIERGFANGTGDDARGSALFVKGTAELRNVVVRNTGGVEEGTDIFCTGSNAHLTLRDCQVVVPEGSDLTSLLNGIGTVLKLEGETVISYE